MSERINLEEIVNDSSTCKLDITSSTIYDKQYMILLKLDLEKNIHL